VLKSFFLCVVLGAAIGFGFTRRQLAHITARGVADIMDIPVDPGDKAKRLARAKTIGQIEGIRAGAASFAAMIGALLGASMWILWQATVWVFG
jgi:hypothetical protein